MTDSDKRKMLGFIPDNTLLKVLIKYLLIPLFAVVVLFLLFDNFLMPWITRHGDEFELPDVMGQTLTDAMTIMDSVGVEIFIAGEEPSPELPEGTIMNQVPPGGSKVKRGRRVKVVISAGRRMVTVPELIGFTQRQSELKLREAGLVAGTFNWAENDSLPVNVIVYTVPSAGSLLPKDDSVHLFFNRGAQTNIVFVPELTGKNLNDAEGIADSIGLIIDKVDYTVNADFLPNTVLWQSQRPGTKVEIGSSIQLKVSVTD